MNEYATSPAKKAITTQNPKTSIYDFHSVINLGKESEPFWFNCFQSHINNQFQKRP
jgi:hypothetical protein